MPALVRSVVRGTIRTFAAMNAVLPAFDHRTWFDISRQVSHRHGVRAFHLPHATIAPFREGGFVGSVEEGGPCRCDVVVVATHGNGTHTECVGHVAGQAYTLRDCLHDMLVTAHVVRVAPERVGDDMVVTADALGAAWSPAGADALVLVTAGEHVASEYSGTNPTYMSTEAMQMVVDAGIQHLLIDQPSVDKEEDAGALAAHRVFWQWPQAPRKHATITELICVPDAVSNGPYVLCLNASLFDADAAPSRPVLFPLL